MDKRSYYPVGWQRQLLLALCPVASLLYVQKCTQADKHVPRNTWKSTGIIYVTANWAVTSVCSVTFKCRRDKCKSLSFLWKYRRHWSTLLNSHFQHCAVPVASWGLAQSSLQPPMGGRDRKCWKEGQGKESSRTHLHKSQHFRTL